MCLIGCFVNCQSWGILFLIGFSCTLSFSLSLFIWFFVSILVANLQSPPPTRPFFIPFLSLVLSISECVLLFWTSSRPWSLYLSSPSQNLCRTDTGSGCALYWQPLPLFVGVRSFCHQFQSLPGRSCARLRTISSLGSFAHSSAILYSNGMHHNYVFRHRFALSVSGANRCGAFASRYDWVVKFTFRKPNNQQSHARIQTTIHILFSLLRRSCGSHTASASVWLHSAVYSFICRHCQHKLEEPNN